MIILTVGNRGARLSSTWMMDLTAGTWTQLQDMSGSRQSHGGCTTSPIGELIIAGEKNGEKYTSTGQAGDLPAELQGSDGQAFIYSVIATIEC